MDPEILKNLREGNTDRVHELLKNNPTQIGCMTVKGNSIFHIAASHGITKAFSSPFIDLLLHPNGIGLLLHQNDGGDTILHCAARTGQTDILEPLIPYYCGIETESQLIGVQNERGETALHEAVRGGHAKAVYLLLAAGPEMAAVVNKDGVSPLYLAAERGSVEAVEKLLFHSTVATGGPRGQTALHAAVYRSLYIVEKLLEIKPELNRQVDHTQSAPIHYAASLGDVNMVHLLLQHNASVAHLLDNKGLSAIHIAASKDNVHMIEVILYHCPDATELTDTEGRNFLHTAAKTRAAAVVKLVLNKSLLRQSINQTDKEGNTPLHLAVKNRSWEMVHLLLSDSGIDTNVINREGLTPLDVASSCTDHNIRLRMNKISVELKSAGSKFGPRRMDPTKGRDKRRSKEELDRYRNLANNLGIVAVLIASVTFAAAFTLPGGYAGDDSKQEQGMAILANKLAFKLFLISDAIAMISSICVTCTIIYTGSLDHDIRLHTITIAMKFMLVALGGMLVAFSMGIYVVLASKCRLLTFLICGMATCVPLVAWMIVRWPTFNFIKREQGIKRISLGFQMHDLMVVDFHTQKNSESYTQKNSESYTQKKSLDAWVDLAPWGPPLEWSPVSEEEIPMSP